MSKRRFNRFLVFILLIFTFNFLFINISYTFEGFLKWAKDFPKRVIRSAKAPETDLTPEKVRKIVAESPNPTYNANPINREAESTIARPLKQIGLGMVDGQIGVVKTFMANKAVGMISGLGKDPKATQAWSNARAVVSRMDPKVANNLNKHFSSSPLGKSIINRVKSNPELAQKVGSEARVGLISVMGTLFNMGIYDGLDLDTVKDRFVNLNAIVERRRKHEEVLGGLGSLYAARYMSMLFGKSFDRVYEAALARSPAFMKADRAVAAFGKRLFKADRLGVKVASGNIAEKWGLVGVGSGTRLTLQGLTRAAAMGSIFGVVGNLACGLTWDLLCGLPDYSIIGANRNRPVERIDDRNYYFQKTGDKWKDFWAEREVAFKNRIEGWRKWPLLNISSGIGGFLGGYIGSVVAGALIIGGGPLGIIAGIGISTLFAGLGSHLMGKFIGSKLDRHPFILKLKAIFWKRNIEKALNNIFFESLGIRPTKKQKELMKKVAEERLKDIKALEKTGQSVSRIKLVEDFSNIKIVKENGYTYLVIDGKNGQKFKEKASPRYDFIDLMGNHGVWDPKTGKIINVGKVKEGAVKGVVFVNKSDIRVKNNKILSKQKDKNFDYLKNGIILLKEDKWKIKGQATTYDIIVRETGERFIWNGSEFVKAEKKKSSDNVTFSDISTPPAILGEGMLYPHIVDNLSHLRRNYNAAVAKHSELLSKGKVQEAQKVYIEQVMPLRWKLDSLKGE